MKYSTIGFFFLCFVFACKGQRHTDYLHMRAMTTNDALGCKDGRIWKQVGDNDWVDIGPITDSCNCYTKEKSFSIPKGPYSNARVFDIGISDAGIYFHSAFGKEDTIAPDGTGVLYPTISPDYIQYGHYLITISKLPDSLALPPSVIIHGLNLSSFNKTVKHLSQ